jgi:hypothetical protein
VEDKQLPPAKKVSSALQIEFSAPRYSVSVGVVLRENVHSLTIGKLKLHEKNPQNAQYNTISKF